jgi:hypothetical protein
VRYKIAIVSIDDVEEECNKAGESGWDLATAFPETVVNQGACCTAPTHSRMVVLIFAKKARGRE